VKDTTSKKIEVLANISIIVVALLACVLLVQNLLPSITGRPTPKATALAPPVGATISLPGVEWGLRNGNILLILSTKCHFCADNAPFYKALVNEAKKRGNVDLIAIFPQTVGESEIYLRGLGLAIDKVVQASLSSVGARGTPTLVLIDNKGKVKNTWMGRISPDKQSEVLRQLQ
jgi:hypothetical protein